MQIEDRASLLLDYLEELRYLNNEGVYSTREIEVVKKELHRVLNLTEV